MLTPSALLDPNTRYTFEVTDGLKDTSGAAFVPFSMTFTTGATGGEAYVYDPEGLLGTRLREDAVAV